MLMNGYYRQPNNTELFCIRLYTQGMQQISNCEILVLNITTPILYICGKSDPSQPQVATIDSASIHVTQFVFFTGGDTITVSDPSGN